MPLVTLAELQKRFTLEALQYVAADEDGALDQARVDQAISDASSEVEGYLSGRYQFPLAAVPEIVERVTCQLAWYYLHGDIKPANVKDQYDRSLALLKSINRGEITLGLSVAGEAAVVVDSAQMVSDKTVWGRSCSQGFI